MLTEFLALALLVLQDPVPEAPDEPEFVSLVPS